MPGRSKDYIRDQKKPNGYQSLHETIYGAPLPPPALRQPLALSQASEARCNSVPAVSPSPKSLTHQLGVGAPRP